MTIVLLCSYCRHMLRMHRTSCYMILCRPMPTWTLNQTSQTSTQKQRYVRNLNLNELNNGSNDSVSVMVSCAPLKSSFQLAEVCNFRSVIYVSYFLALVQYPLNSLDSMWYKTCISTKCTMLEGNAQSVRWNICSIENSR